MIHRQPAGQHLPHWGHHSGRPVANSSKGSRELAVNDGSRRKVLLPLAGFEAYAVEGGAVDRRVTRLTPTSCVRGGPLNHCSMLSSIAAMASLASSSRG